LVGPFVNITRQLHCDHWKNFHSSTCSK